MISQDWYTLTSSSSKSATTYAYELPPCRYHRGVAVLISNTVSGASGTLDAKLQYKHPISLAWTDIPSAAFVQWGAGATAEKFIQVYPTLTASDADSQITLSTHFRIVGLYAMRYMRLYVTVGTGAITFSAGCYLLP